MSVGIITSGLGSPNAGGQFTTGLGQGTIQVVDLVVTSIEVISPVQVRIHFSTGVDVTRPETLDPHNYAFEVQFGFAQKVYAARVVPSNNPVPINRTYVDVFLRDYMSVNSHYVAVVQNIYSVFGLQIL